MPFRVAEHLTQRFQERRVRIVVRPHREHAPGLEEGLHPPQAVLPIEIRMGGIEQLPRRVVDVQQHRVPAPPRLRRIEPLSARQREEIRVEQRATRIGRQFLAVGHQPAPVPIDHRLQRLHHHQPRHLRKRQRRRRRVAQPQPADHDLPPAARQRPQPQPRQLLLRLVEQARHQVLAVQLHLDRLRPVQRQHPPPLQDQFPQRCLPVVQFFELRFHRPPTVPRHPPLSHIKCSGPPLPPQNVRFILPA